MKEKKNKIKLPFIETNIIRLEKDHIKLAAKTLARSFQIYPLWVSVFPDSTKRMNNALPNIFELGLKHAILYGEVYALENMRGIAIWYPPKKVHMTMISLMRAGMYKIPFKVGIKNMPKLMKIMDFTTKTHNRLISSDHWYLFCIGVDPDYQGKSYSSALLKPMHARIGREGLPIYLETHEERNVTLFKHFGYKLIDEAVIPNLNVTNWAMLKE